MRQKTVTKAWLRPRIDELRKWIDRQPGALSAWHVMEQHYAAMVETARAYVKDFECGGISHKPTREACRDVLAVADSVDRREAITLVIAMLILMLRDDGVFVSQDGFHAQLARRWRGMTETHVAEFWSHKDQRVHKVYRDPRRRSLLALGKMLSDGLGRCAISVMEAQRREAQKAEALAKADIAGMLLGEAQLPSDTARRTA